MKQLFKYTSLSLLFAFIFTACSTSNSVVSNRLIQKRKYNSGFHVDAASKYGNKKQNETIAYDNGKIIEEEVLVRADAANNEAINTKGLEQNAEVRLDVPATNESEPKVEESRLVKKTTSFETNNATAKNSVLVPAKKNVVQRVKELKKQVKEIKKSVSASSDDLLFLILLVILALILPPLAVFIVDGDSNIFWLTLILWLIGWGVGLALFGFGIAALCSLAAAIIALLVVLELI